jgi:hypothetical protein
MPKVFISYRRADSEGIAGRIYDRLVQEFGEAEVFMDVDSIQGGSEFPAVLAATLEQSHAVLVLIGDRWLSIQKGARRRLDDPDDFVRREVAAALKSGALVIPLLVGQASMPEPNDLPPDIRKLAALHARPVRHGTDFHRDLGRVLQDIAGGRRTAPPSPAPAGRRHAPPPGSVPERMVALLADLWYKRKSAKESAAARKALANAFPGEFKEWGGDEALKWPHRLAVVILRSKYEFSEDILSECQEVCEARAEGLAQAGELQEALDLIGSLPAEHQRQDLLASFGERQEQLQQNYRRINSALEADDTDELREAVEERRQLVPRSEGFTKRLARKWALLADAYRALADFPPNGIPELRRLIEILRSRNRVLVASLGCGGLIPFVIITLVFLLCSFNKPQRIELLNWTPEDNRTWFWGCFLVSAALIGVIGAIVAVALLLMYRNKARARTTLLTQRPYSWLLRECGGKPTVEDGEALLIILDAVEFRHG